MYANGQGVKQNFQLAKSWFGKACDNAINLVVIIIVNSISKVIKDQSAV
ncbi:SEL1-like repeat protein [Testudinibacter sp. TR-2022]|nr:SEL1-like repeat protein [Testudinibacter sp. TR-2022]